MSNARKHISLRFEQFVEGAVFGVAAFERHVHLGHLGVGLCPRVPGALLPCVAESVRPEGHVELLPDDRDLAGGGGPGPRVEPHHIVPAPRVGPEDVPDRLRLLLVVGEQAHVAPVPELLAYRPVSVLRLVHVHLGGARVRQPETGDDFRTRLEHQGRDARGAAVVAEGQQDVLGDLVPLEPVHLALVAAVHAHGLAEAGEGAEGRDGELAAPDQHRLPSDEVRELDPVILQRKTAFWFARICCKGVCTECVTRCIPHWGLLAYTSAPFLTCPNCQISDTDTIWSPDIGSQVKI